MVSPSRALSVIVKTSRIFVWSSTDYSPQEIWRSVQVQDLKWISVWCKEYAVDFGHLILAAEQDAVREENPYFGYDIVYGHETNATES